MDIENDLYKKLSKKEIQDSLMLMASKVSFVFVGTAGCGKSSIGCQIAKILFRQFFDTDSEIEEAAKMTALSIYQEYTEGAFRSTEVSVTKRLLTYPAIVLSTGDSAFLDAELRERILSTTITIWLYSDAHTLFNRLKNSRQRPHLINSKDPERTLEKVVASREPYYRQTHIKVKSDDQTYNKMVNRVLYSYFLYKKHLEEGIPMTMPFCIEDYSWIDLNPIVCQYQDKAAPKQSLYNRSSHNKWSSR
jgi:shikimate kinase